MNSKRATTAADIGLFLLRLHAGVSICSGGYDKFPAPNWFVDQVGGLGWPAPALFANCAGAAEYIGGALLVVGLLTRPVAVFLTITMAVAAFQLQEIRALRTINVAHLYFWVYLMFVFTGAGSWSLDRLFSKSVDEATKPIWARRLIAALVIGGAIAAFGFMKTPNDPQPEASIDIVSVSLAGSFNDWDLAATPLDNVKGERWSATVAFEAATPIEFKFAGNESWNLSGGEEDESTRPFPASGTLEMSNAAGNITTYIPTAGDYRFELNLEDMSYTVTRVAE